MGSSSPLHRNFFTAGFLPDAPRAVQEKFDEVQRVSEEAMIEDMEEVAAASGLDRFALLGLSQGAAYCLRY